LRNSIGGGDEGPRCFLQRLFAGPLRLSFFCIFLKKYKKSAIEKNTLRNHEYIFTYYPGESDFGSGLSKEGALMLSIIFGDPRKKPTDIEEIFGLGKKVINLPEEELSRLLKEYFKNGISTKNLSLVTSNDYELTATPIDSIDYILVSGKKSILYCHVQSYEKGTVRYREKIVEARETLDSLEEKVVRMGFFRISRNCIVNLAKVEQIRKLEKMALLNTGELLVVSQRKLSLFVRAFCLFKQDGRVFFMEEN